MSTLVGLSNSQNEETAGGAVYAMPATPTQVRLWQMEQARGANASWNVATRFRLAGRLDREKLEQSLQLLTTRHEALRTSFELNNDKVVERIAPRATVGVEWCDLRALSGEAQAGELRRLSEEHARQPLLLRTAPLFRVRMLRLGEDEHVMLWNAHHAICDGWSVGLLTRDLMACYGELVSGREPAAKVSLDYGDYAVWLEAQRRTPEYEAHRAYWKARLEGAAAPRLPGGWKNRECSEAAPAIHSAIHSVVLPRRMTDALEGIARRYHATFFHVTLAAFAVFLRQQQEQAEVAIGTPLSGRDQAELEPIAGTFVNYVPLRFPVTGEERFRQTLHAVRELATDAAEHGQFRFEDMLQHLDGRDASAGDEKKLFSAAFITQKDFVRPISMGGVTLTGMPSVSAGAVRPLTVFMVERPDGWRLSCEVDNRTVSAAAGRSILQEFERLLEAVAADPEESVARLAARAGIAPASRGRNAIAELPAAAPPEGAVRIPATEFQRRLWQLDEVDSGATALHIRVRMEFTGPLNVDALMKALEKLTRKHEILRTTLEETSGRIWQVIHPEMPIDFRFFVSDCQAPDAERTAAQRAVDEGILEREGRARFSFARGPLFRTRVLRVEKDRHWVAITLSHGVVDGWSAGLFLEELQQAYERQVEGTAEGAGAAPVLQFSDYARREQRLLAGEEKKRRLQWWEETLKGMWMPLTLPRDIDGPATSEGDAPAGLKVTPLAADAALSARRFARESQTTLFAVFGAAFQALLSRYSGQKDVLFLTPHANRVDDTETILGPLADPLCVAGHIDDPISFRELVAQFSGQSMDAVENALPLNVVTPMVEMRVAEGYHPLNQIIFFYQRAFVHDMEWKSLRVQPLPDTPTVTGSEWQLGVVERGEGIFLEFLYDATLYSQRSIQLATRHFTRLLARAIAEPDKALSQIDILTPEEVRDYSISGSVPPIIERLLPGAHAVLPAASGVEIAASVGEQNLNEQNAEVMVIRTFSQAEQNIVELWKQLFKTDDLNAESNFFDLGGHSLLLTRLQRFMKRDFGVQLTAADVFRHPTISTLAGWLERAQSAARLAAKSAAEGAAGHPATHNPRVIPIQPKGSGWPIFVISQSMIFRKLAAELGTEQPVYALQMLEEDNLATGASSFAEIVGFYVRLIREVQPSGPYRLAGWCVSGWIAYGVARQLESEGAEIEMLMVIDAWAPAYWTDQPPLRRRLMLAVYELQRARRVGRELAHASGSEPGAGAGMGRHGFAATVKRVITRINHSHTAVQPADAEELGRSQRLKHTARGAALTGPLKGKVLLFRSEEEPTGPFLAPDMGWAQLLGRPVDVEILPGNHHEIFGLPGARMMAARGLEMLGLASATYAVADAALAAGPRPATRTAPLAGA